MVAITDITEGTVNGNGYFDKLMAAVNAQIDLQFGKQRIQKADYAVVYLGAIQSAMAQAIQFATVVEQVAASQAKTTSETALLDQKTKTEMAQILDDVDQTTVVGLIGALKTLQAAQAAGFVRDAEQKASKILLDAWAISRSVVGAAFPVPSGALNGDIEDVLEKLRIGISITQSIFLGVADAGPDQTVGTSSFVTLDASGCTNRPNAQDTPVPPSGYIWTKESGSTSPTLDPVIDVETTTIVTTFDSLTADVLVYKLEALYADSVDQSSSFDYVTITVE